MKKGKVFLVILSVIIGALFLFSAWAKTEPSPAYFEYVISSQLPVSAQLAALTARFFIGLEAALGLLLMVNVLGYKRWTLKASLLLLVVFSFHLIYLLFSQGNDVNCGCMGNVAPMTPAMSLLKNAGLIAALLLLLKYYKPNDGAVLNIATFPIAMIIMAVPFFLFPIEKQKTMPLSKLYNSKDSEQPKTELRRGKHVLCFMSLSCKHCREAAKLMQQMKTENPALPFYFALSSGSSDSTRAERFADFIADTKATDIPYHFVSKEDFMDMIKYSGSDGVPVILWMRDTTVIRKVSIPELNKKELEEWLKQ